MLEIGKDPALDDRSAPLAQPARRQLVGNRWALAGAIMYLLEWVVIAVGSGGGSVPSGSGASSASIVQTYSQHATSIALSAGAFALVLPGRILLVAGIRQALRRSWGESPLADLAVGAMAVSVALEIATFAVAAGVGHAATSGVDQSSVVTGDAIANLLNLSLFSPIGLSILAIAVVMLQSRLFPWWLCWLGIAAGATNCVLGVIAGAGFQGGGQLQQVGNVLMSVGVIGFWIWMLVTGVLLFRAAGDGVVRKVGTVVGYGCLGLPALFVIAGVASVCSSAHPAG